MHRHGFVTGFHVGVVVETVVVVVGVVDIDVVVAVVHWAMVTVAVGRPPTRSVVRAVWRRIIGISSVVHAAVTPTRIIIIIVVDRSAHCDSRPEGKQSNQHR